MKTSTFAQRVLAALKLTGMAAMALSFITMLALTGCPTETGPSGDPELSGTIKIQKGGADVAAANTGDTLTADYNGTETVTYQWNKDGTAIASGGTSAAYMPGEAGSYTVTVSASGYQSKISTAVTVSGSTLQNLSGTIKIQKGGAVVAAANTGDTLTAVYSGNETVSYQWNKDGTSIYFSGTTYVTDEAGDYTVTVSASSYISKTSEKVTVSGTTPGVKNEDLAAYLGNLTGTADEPDTVIIAPQTLTYFYKISDIVKTAQKYVVLDLSYCSIDDSDIGDLTSSLQAHSAGGGNTYVVGLILPDTITVIEMSAFEGCTSLKSITIPDSVETIGYEAFKGCTSLKSITIPDSVETIENQAFQGCTSLESVTISDGVISIGNLAFYNCTSLKSITIPGTVTEIGTSTFSGCSGLTSVTISDGVETIGEDAFYNSNFSSLESITIPDSVTSIGGRAFYVPFNFTLKTVTFGANTNITTWGAECFNYATTSAGKTGLKEAYNAATPKAGTYNFNNSTGWAKQN